MGWIGLAIIAVVAVAVLVVIKIVNKKQAIVGKLAMLLFIFLILSGSYVVLSRGIDITSAKGVMKATGTYFSWAGHILSNSFKITGYAVKQDWGVPIHEGDNYSISEVVNATNSTG